MWGMIESGGWTVFDHMELLFVIGLPIGLAKKAQARAVMESFVIYMIWNTNINYILNTWNFGVDMSNVEDAIGIKEIGGVATLDTNLIGALLISGLAVYLHNRFFDTPLPEWLGIFSGSSFVVMLGFFMAIPLAFLTAWIWPSIQDVISQLQGFMASSGTAGVGIYVFLQRLLIPTGLHHFINQPFEFGPAAVEGGLLNYWFENLSEIAAFDGSIREIFPQGGFMLQNAPMFFFPIGIGAAFVATSKPEKWKKTMALVIPTAATAMIAGITEPFEFTFLFLAPQLFAVHAALTSIFAMTIYAFGLAGGFAANIGGITGVLLPMAENHLDAIFIYFASGIVLTFIYYFAFRWVILKFNLKTPGREEDEEVHMYSKKEYKAKKAEEKGAASSDEGLSDVGKKALGFLNALGGTDNIADINNCTTRLRISVKDPDQLENDAFFKNYGAYGVVRNGKAIQVIVGMEVPKVREEFERIVNDNVS
ncbi:PTS transporter subunit EIIC [Tetragenococcus halophilus]|uniref:PTS transporter subunit EIIC n=1 Tax=Tetragenococcus halophilus TaxID=51669 RepID=UPI00295F4FFE|nr:PTS transporter subunit EIIC [Tetragenococcus halophilus]